jgi:hypothetical protein
MDREQFICSAFGVAKSNRVEGRGRTPRSKVSHQGLCGNVADKLILGHRASANPIHGTIEATATRGEGSLDFLHGRRRV